MATNTAALRRDIRKQEDDIQSLYTMLNSDMFANIDDPDVDPGTKELYDRAQATLVDHQAELDRMKKRLAAEAPKEAPPEPPKWSVEAHPILGKLGKQEPAKEQTFAVGDLVEAKWTDKQWYKAKVTTVTGSQTSPRYTVVFTGYKETMTLERESLRPVQGTKRKAESFSAPQVTAPKAPTSSTVISAAPNLKPGVLDQAAKPAEGDEAPKKKFRSIRSNKKLEETKKSWQAFQAKGPKAVKKESMFRTGTAIGSRVGFTGSGRAMTKDQIRVKNRYKKEDDDEEDVVG